MMAFYGFLIYLGFLVVAVPSFYHTYWTALLVQEKITSWEFSHPKGYRRYLTSWITILVGGVISLAGMLPVVFGA